MAAEPWSLASNLDPSLERSGLRDPERIDRLLLVVAIAVRVSHLQGYGSALPPIPLQVLEPCMPSRGVRRRQNKPWFSRIELLRCVRQSGSFHWLTWIVLRPLIASMATLALNSGLWVWRLLMSGSPLPRASWLGRCVQTSNRPWRAIRSPQPR